jgi:hypothetical protein
MVPTFTSYEEFWPYYVSEHREPLTRVLHFAGTTLVLLAVGMGLTVDWRWLLTPPFFGYGFAWVGHFFVEHNKPATFTHPGWSLRGDFRMFRLMLLGRMGPELERADRLFPRASAAPAAPTATGH